MGFLPPPLRRTSHHRGFALILVVIAIALATAMAVFFLANVGRERRGVDLYSRGSDARHLADTAVNLVQGQISTATKEGTAVKPVSWASQPGMIRTYGQNGQLSNAYKLYSWDKLVETSTLFNPNDPTELPASGWASLPAQYTDLNQPVNGVYPIVDPTIADRVSTAASAFSSNSPAGINWDFPGEVGIIQDKNKGYYNSANDLPMPVKWLYVLQDGTWIAPTGASGATASFLNLPPAQTPSTANPIVGRMAFWTDDETSKVNINTASEGSYWDTPKAATEDELQFAANPPTRGEFQRILGHPATTSLSAVFPEMRTGTFSRWSSSGTPPTNYQTHMQEIFGVAPRISWGGSQAGTYPITSYTQTYPPSTVSGYTPASIVSDTDRLYASADDLLFRAPVITNGVTASQLTRSFNTAFDSSISWSASPTIKLTPAQLAKRLFLFTSDSRAPETTLFETPRISLWPITWPYSRSTYYVSGGRTNPSAPTVTVSPSNLVNNPWMTYQERLLASCSTLQTEDTTTVPKKVIPTPYYFQRQNPDSPSYDWTNFKRNQDLVSYLSREMHTAVPGMGSNMSLSGKFNASSDWIALNCFDFSRSLINQYTYNQIDRAGSTTISDYLYTYTGLQIKSGVINGGFKSSISEPNAYAVAPLHVPVNGVNYTSEGAFPALKEASLVFYATSRTDLTDPTVDHLPKLKSPLVNSDKDDPANWDSLIYYDQATNTGKSQTTQMQAVLLLSFAGMGPGVWSFRGQTFYAPTFWVKVSRVPGEGSFLVDGNSINFPTENGDSVQYCTLRPSQGGSDAFISSVVNSLVARNTAGTSTTKTFNNASTGYNNWSLASKLIPMSYNKATFNFTGAKIQIDIYGCLNGDITQDPTANNAHPELLISSQQIDFGDWTSTQNDPRHPGKPLPIPLAPRWNVRQATLSTNTSTSTVPMPNLFPTLPSHTYDANSSAVSGWATELVPSIGLLTGMDPLTSYDPRVSSGSSAGKSYVFNGIADGSAEPLIYAYTSNSGLVSTSFKNRVDACRRLGGFAAEGTTGTLTALFGGSQPHTPAQSYQLVTPYDTAISMVSDPTSTSAADPRLMGRGTDTSAGQAGATNFVRIDVAANSLTNTPSAPLANVTASPLRVVFDQNTSLMYARSTTRWQHHSLSTMPGMRYPTGYFLNYQYAGAPNVLLATRGAWTQTNGVGPVGYLLGRDGADAMVGVDTNVTNIISPKWDWTTLPGNFADGGYVNRPDQDYQVLSPGGNNSGTMRVPYFNDAGLESSTDATSTGNQSLNVFMPNRQIPSPVILGTLPSDMKTGWQTLDFCPNPAITMNGLGTHPGPGAISTSSTNRAVDPVYSTLPDHLLLDLFWMPVAEPYPVSDQLSTAGKVNLNYAMMPFPYIQRKTGLDAVLKSVWLTALPTPAGNPTYSTNATAYLNSNTFAQFYKSYALLYQHSSHLDRTHTRYPVNVNSTLQAFDYKFNQGDIFRSASQVCDMFLYPNRPDATDQLPSSSLITDNAPQTSNITAWWKSQALTADNAREDPYNAIYSRITTKSNTFTVHWKVQVLRKPSKSDPATWTEGKDGVASELRGSTLIERYIDPNATNIPDYATDSVSNPTALPLSQYYKWRTVAENYFHP